MELQSLSKSQRQELQLRELLLEETETKSHRSSLQRPSKPKLQLSILTPPKMAKHRSRKAQVQVSRESSVAGLGGRADEPEEFQAGGEGEFVYNKYDIWDLTYSLVSAKIDKRILVLLFVIQVTVRYFSILSLVYITLQTYSQHWQWIFILIFTNTLYFICIVKVSLKPAETQSEFILKQSFNSLEENEANDYFQVISPWKFLTSVARGMVPPEFSCLYIRDSERRGQIYAMINYIYSSIEAVIYYPFFIIYMLIIIKKDKQLDSRILFYISVALICLFELIFLATSLYLLLFGCRRKGLLKPTKDK